MNVERGYRFSPGGHRAARPHPTPDKVDCALFSDPVDERGDRAKERVGVSPDRWDLLPGHQHSVGIDNRRRHLGAANIHGQNVLHRLSMTRRRARSLERSNAAYRVRVHAPEQEVHRAVAIQTAAESVDHRPESFADLHRLLSDNIGHVIQGKDDAIDLVLLCLIAGGHLLVEDVPGVGKTTLAKALATSIHAEFGRIQFTPDLLPTDVVGVNVWNRGTNTFEFRRGPVFANIVLADEINRASPKTQSALLEAMAEAQVTVDGTTHLLAQPFLVIATQNPIEHEGTYALPESQLDRFLMRISMGYPARQAELDILESHGDGERLKHLQPVVSGAQVKGLVTAASTVHVAPPLRGYLVDLAEASRRHSATAVGMSPRATLALQRVARARAATRGRTYVVPDDIKALAQPVLAHRILLTPGAQVSGTTAADVVADILDRVPVPAARPLDSTD